MFESRDDLNEKMHMAIELNIAQSDKRILNQRNNFAEENDVCVSNADEILEKIDARKYYIFIMILVSLTWGILAMPTMASAFINDVNECDENVTAYCNETNNPDYRLSIVSEFELKGEMKYLAEWATSAFMAGDMVGALIFSHISDRFGRRPVVFFSLLVMSLAGLAASLANSIQIFTTARFFQGISKAFQKWKNSIGTPMPLEHSIKKFPNLFHTTLTPLFINMGMGLSAWILAYESIPINLRGIDTILFGITWVTGYCIVAPAAYFLKNWRYLMIATAAPSAIAIFVYPFFVPESFHYLTSNKKVKMSVKWIENAQKFEGKCKKVNAQLMIDSLLNNSSGCNSSENNPQKNSFWKELGSNKTFIVHFIILAYIWIINAALYYGLSLYTTKLAGSKYWNFVMSGLVEIPAYTIGPLALERFGRKPIISILHILTGASLITIAVVPKGWVSLSLILWLLGKLFISSTFMCIYPFTNEISPTNIRSIILSSCSLIARIGSISAPLIQILMHLHPLFPTLFFAISSLLAGLLTIFLPETNKLNLPASLKDIHKKKEQF